MVKESVCQSECLLGTFIEREGIDTSIVWGIVRRAIVTTSTTAAVIRIATVCDHNVSGQFSVVKDANATVGTANDDAWHCGLDELLHLFLPSGEGEGRRQQ